MLCGKRPCLKLVIKKSAGAFGVREYISKSWLLLYTHPEEKNFKVYNILPIKNI